MKRLILTFFLLFGAVSMFAQTTMSIADVNGVAGSNVAVAVDVANFDNIGSITLKINFDPDVLSFVELQNNQLANQGTLLSPSSNNGALNISWFDLSPLAFTDGKLMDIIFSYVGGESDVTFNSGTEITTTIGGSVSITYTNGSVSGGGQLPLGIPALQAPQNNSTGVGLTPTLNWSDVTDATVYDVQVSTGETFSSTVIDESDLTSSSYTVSEGVLENLTQYYWRARAKNDSMDGQWSTAFNFTTESGVVVSDIVISLDDITVSPNSEAVMPVNVENFNDIGSMTLRINYDDSKLTYKSISNAPSGTIANPVAGVLSIAWADLSGSNPLNLGNAKLLDITFDYTTGDVPLTFSNQSELTNSSNQMLEVTFVDGNILEGQALPDVPVLSAPEDGSTGVILTPDLTWAAVTDAASYSLELASDAEFTTKLVEESGLTSTQYTVASGTLSNSTTYYWRVSAANSAGSSDFSDAFSFTTVLPDLDPPTLAAPEDNATDVELSPLFTWSNVDGATSFNLQVSTASDFTALVVDETGITMEEFDMTASLEELTTYYWRVNATDGSRVSAWSTVFSFTTLTTVLPTPVLSSPENDASGVLLSATSLVWNSVEGAETYSVELATDSEFSNVVASQTDASSTSYSIGDGIMDYETTYYWRVKAAAEGKESEWSPVWNFLTELAPLSAPELVSPADGSTDLLLGVTFEWNAVENADSYGLQVATDNTFTSPVVDESGLSETTLSLESDVLEGLTEYYWRVNAADESRTSEWSAVWSFTTEDPLSVNEFKSGIPDEFSLMQNYPNPFNPSTSIRYALPEAAQVKIVVVDLLGREVSRLLNSFQPAGYFEITWNANNVSSGNYIYKIDVKTESGKMFSEMKKMQFLK